MLHLLYWILHVKAVCVRKKRMYIDNGARLEEVINFDVSPLRKGTVAETCVYCIHTIMYIFHESVTSIGASLYARKGQAYSRTFPKPGLAAGIPLEYSGCHHPYLVHSLATDVHRNHLSVDCLM